LQNHPGVFGRGAEDCEEGAEDPEDQGKDHQELSSCARIGIAVMF
jgi:hypothetical protein